MDTIIWARPRLFSIDFWRFQKNAKSLKPPLPSQVVSDATWSAFNGRLAAVSEGQAYFSSVHRVHRAKTSLARTLRQLCQAHPELTLFAAEEFCTKALAEVLGEFWGGILGGKTSQKLHAINCIFATQFEVGECSGYVPHHSTLVQTLQTSTI